MNWLLRLFAVYFISLSLLSCNDNNEKNSPLSQNVHTTDHSSHNEHNESCSPFCSCSCCSIQLIVHHPGIDIKTPAFFTKPDFSALHFNIFNIHLPIWQPPQLS